MKTSELITIFKNIPCVDVTSFARRVSFSLPVMIHADIWMECVCKGTSLLDEPGRLHGVLQACAREIEENSTDSGIEVTFSIHSSALGLLQEQRYTMRTLLEFDESNMPCLIILPAKN